MKKVKKQRQIVLATIAFGMGCLFYYFFRCYGLGFIPGFPSNCVVHGVGLLDSIPSFIHVFVFGLSHNVIFKVRYFVGPLVWLLINLFFEIGQLLPQDMTFASPYLNYFTYGTFDWFDIIFALVGAVCALVVIELPHQQSSV